MSGLDWSVLHTNPHISHFSRPLSSHLFQVATPAALLAEVDYVIPYLVFTEAVKCLVCTDTVWTVSPISAQDLRQQVVLCCCEC